MSLKCLVKTYMQDVPDRFKIIESGGCHPEFPNFSLMFLIDVGLGSVQEG